MKKVMTPEEFKLRWESDAQGGGITFDEIADCAKAWGLYPTARIYSLNKVAEAVLKKAGVGR